MFSCQWLEKYIDRIKDIKIDRQKGRNIESSMDKKINKKKERRV